MHTAIKSTIRLAVVLVSMLLALFLPAGTPGWPLGWAFFISFVVWIAITIAYLRRTNPEVIEARSRIREGTKSWDRLVFQIIMCSMIGICAVAGFDSGRFHWSKPPGWGVAIGYLLYCIGEIEMLWPLAVNKFAESTVRVQSDRGQRPIDTGPYAIVRHPMYVGAIIWFAGIPLALGSLWALIPAGVAIITMLVRTVLEDRTLQRELPGYAEYATRVRYRLIPGVW